MDYDVDTTTEWRFTYFDPIKRQPHTFWSRDEDDVRRAHAVHRGPKSQVQSRLVIATSWRSTPVSTTTVLPDPGPDVHPGQLWVRTSNGRIVRITSVDKRDHQSRTGAALASWRGWDIGWENVAGPQARGSLFGYNFVKRYTRHTPEENPAP